MSAPRTVLVLGQTPPPMGGQALMIQHLVEAPMSRVRLVHVRMGFSSEMSEVGRARARKVFHLLVVIAKVWYRRLASGADCLYYPPAPPTRVPVYRDIALLLATRWMFRRTVFHFHAGGLSKLYPELHPVVRWAFRRAYMRPDLAIRVGHTTPRDGEFLLARREVVIYCGVKDHAGPRSAFDRSGVSQILMMTRLMEDKGLWTLLEACNLLHREGAAFRLDLAGEFSPQEERERVADFSAANDLEDRVSIHGVVTGTRKQQLLANAHIYCFPTFVESETLPVALLEAMQFELPIVATNWGGIPELVSDHRNGYLVPVRDAEATADRLARLISDDRLRRDMGTAGRRMYEEKFALPRFQLRMEDALASVVSCR